jgi:hypothetical protein
MNHTPAHSFRPRPRQNAKPKGHRPLANTSRSLRRESASKNPSAGGCACWSAVRRKQERFGGKRTALGWTLKLTLPSSRGKVRRGVLVHQIAQPERNWLALPRVTTNPLFFNCLKVSWERACRVGEPAGCVTMTRGRHGTVDQLASPLWLPAHSGMISGPGRVLSIGDDEARASGRQGRPEGRRRTGTTAGPVGQGSGLPCTKPEFPESPPSTFRPGHEENVGVDADAASQEARATGGRSNRDGPKSAWSG